MKNLELRPLTLQDEKSFRAAIQEFSKDCPSIDFAFNFEANTDFSEYLKTLQNWSLGNDLPEKFVANSYYVAIVAGQVVGRLSLRHNLNEFLAEIGGHIGYAIIPSQRGQGFATQMLKQALQFSKALGIERVLITCNEDNLASIRVIEKCGGVYERTTLDTTTETSKRRYWIAMAS